MAMIDSRTQRALLFRCLLIVVREFRPARGGNDALDCELYLAPSTIPNAGLGTFMGSKGKRAGDVVGNGDVCIPIMDTDWHNGIGEEPVQESALDDYMWEGPLMGMGFEVSVHSGDIYAYWPGLDGAINCHIPLYNTGRSFPLQNLSNDDGPGIGSMTPFRAGETRLVAAVPAGGELFKHYGDKWFEFRQDAFGNIPLTDDYIRMNDLLVRFLRLFDGDMRNSMFGILHSLRETWDSRTLNALPSTIDEVKLAAEHGMKAVHQPNATRSIEWLQEHGRCIDHIVPRKSDIRGAGEGAFAKRKLPKETTITASPLLHVPHYKFMEMYDAHMAEEDTWDDPNIPKWMKTESVTNHQIALNYCFGHRDTTMLLCPYGAGVNYINHNRELANVRIQWSKDGIMGQNDAFFDLAPEDMEEILSASLTLEYVATRDIEEGEELYLDYGDDWIAAQEEHVSNWEDPKNWALPDIFNASQIYVKIQSEEIQTNPYPENTQIRCHHDLSDEHWQNRVENGQITWKRIRLDLRFPHHSWFGLPCTVTARNDTDNTYTVALTVDNLTWFYDEKRLYGESSMRFNVPRAALFFATAYEKSDLSLPNVFRHHIGLPDELIPYIWKNRQAAHKDGTTTET